MSTVSEFNTFHSAAWERNDNSWAVPLCSLTSWLFGEGERNSLDSWRFVLMWKVWTEGCKTNVPKQHYLLSLQGRFGRQWVSNPSFFTTSETCAIRKARVLASTLDSESMEEGLQKGKNIFVMVKKLELKQTFHCLANTWRLWMMCLLRKLLIWSLSGFLLQVAWVHWQKWRHFMLILHSLVDPQVKWPHFSRYSSCQFTTVLIMFVQLKGHFCSWICAPVLHRSCVRESQFEVLEIPAPGQSGTPEVPRTVPSHLNLA